MTLPNVTLFPGALLPLYIFEPRYRAMLARALDGDRMFCVALRRPGRPRNAAMPVAGLGLIRLAVGHPDGTSHLILQGVARVTLEETVRSRPYRIERIRPLKAPPCDSVAMDALLAKVHELLQERLALGLPFPASAAPHAALIPPLSFFQKDSLFHLDTILDPEQAADLIAYAVMPGARERQAMLETVDVESRLRRLIKFLLEELREHRKKQP